LPGETTPGAAPFAFDSKRVRFLTFPFLGAPPRTSFENSTL
jgi:hypothetical protein